MSITLTRLRCLFGYDLRDKQGHSNSTQYRSYAPSYKNVHAGLNCFHLQHRYTRTGLEEERR
jgi:hypothetical protein